MESDRKGLPYLPLTLISLFGLFGGSGFINGDADADSRGDLG